MRTTNLSSTLLISCLALLAHPLQAAPLRLDLSLDSGRSDTATRGWHEWQVPNGKDATKEFDGVKITLRSLGEEAALEGRWFKAGLATGASLATDGVVAVAQDKPTLVVEIEGLAAGEHSLTTFHNAVSGNPSSAGMLSIKIGDQLQEVKPTYRAESNEQSESAYSTFTAVAGKPVQLEINGTGEVILNGLVIDGPDPKYSARHPMPADEDGHVDGDDGSVTLSWQPAPSAVKHRVLVVAGRDSEEIKRQLEENPNRPIGMFYQEVTGNQIECPSNPKEPLLQYCWRVDSVDAQGKVTPGEVWCFRVRHPAFPGAEGWGRFAIGGRGGRVIKVTNLNDSGPGSLRAALETNEPRTVVFDVSGRIVLAGRLVVKNPYLTLAGQTAPGKGICISNYNLGLFGTHDCIVRFVRVRPGDTAGQTLDGMGMASSDHSIVDHCSISWTQDESFSSRGAKNITLQRTLISEALNVAGHKKYEEGKRHGYAASIGGDVGSFHHNLLAHCEGRNWSLAGGIDKAGVHAGRLDLRNNVVYNWGHRTTDGGAKEVNFVNNYYLPGPASEVFHVLMPQHELPFGPQEYFVEGNVMVDHYGADERYAGVKEFRNEKMEDYLVEEPFFESYVKTTTAEQAFEDVLADVGCNRPQLDEHDKRILEEVRSRATTYSGSRSGVKGLPDSQEDVGGWEDYPEMHRDENWDTDSDGLPNWWEEKQGLNPNSPEGDLTDTHGDPDRDGYTNMEEYLDWMANNTYSE